MKKLALYHGDEFVGIYETFFQIAETIGCHVKTARFYATPVYHSRIEAKKPGEGNAWIVEKIDLEEEE